MKNNNWWCLCVLAIVLLFSQAIAADEDQELLLAEHFNGQIHLECPEAFVEGFPWLVSVEIQADGEVRSIIWTDIASVYGGGAGNYFEMESQGGQVIQLGYERLGFPGDEYGIGIAQMPVVYLEVGDKVFFVIDISRLRRRNKNKNFTLGPGEWTLRVRNSYTDGVSNTKTVTIRHPNGRERDYLESYFPPRSGNIIFPYAVVLPNADKLPPETRPAAELIKIFRTAVLFPAEGERLLRESELDWGYLFPLTILVRYDCLRLSDQMEEARILREEYEEEYGKLNFDLVDKGLGVVTRLRNPPFEFTDSP